MTNRWYRQDYVQGFDYESITLKKYVNMFDRMQFHKYIYEGVVEPSYKNLPGKTPTVLVTEGKRYEKPSHHGLALRRVRALTSAEKDM